MTVLWYSITPSCYDVQHTGSWIEALEKVFKRNLPHAELGIAFERQDEVFKVNRERVIYYPYSHSANIISPK